MKHSLADATPALIGLCSPAMGSGKTTVAEYLEHAYGFKIVRFAGPLKSMIHRLLTDGGMTDAEATEAMTDPVRKEQPCGVLNGHSPRHAMQTLGTEWGRACLGTRFWINAAMTRVNALRKMGHPVVVDDLRFRNEAEAIEVFGGRVFRVVRPGQQITRDHASEGELDSHKVADNIVNNGSMAELQRTVGRVIVAPYLPSRLAA